MKGVAGVLKGARMEQRPERLSIRESDKEGGGWIGLVESDKEGGGGEDRGLMELCARFCQYEYKILNPLVKVCDCLFVIGCVVCGCLWLFVVVCGCLWLFVVVCGCLWLFVVVWFWFFFWGILLISSLYTQKTNYHTTHQPHHKVGVLYCANKQTTEKEMYQNTKTSYHFDEFVESLGQKFVADDDNERGGIPKGQVREEREGEKEGVGVKEKFFLLLIFFLLRLVFKDSGVVLHIFFMSPLFSLVGVKTKNGWKGKGSSPSLFFSFLVFFAFSFPFLTHFLLLNYYCLIHSFIHFLDWWEMIRWLWCMWRGINQSTLKFSDQKLLKFIYLFVQECLEHTTYRLFIFFMIVDY